MPPVFSPPTPSEIKSPQSKLLKACMTIRLLVLPGFLCLAAALSAHGENALKGGENKPPAIIPNSLDISGKVMDATPDLWQAFDKIEAAAAKSEEEWRQAMASLPSIPPASNVVVALRGKSIARETVTDADGNFRFAALPPGDYEVSTQVSLRPTGVRGRKRPATARERITLGSSSRSVRLRLRADLVNVKGRITDVQGKPVAGAKVTAIEEIHDQAYLENHNPRTWSTMSGKDGSYELQGLEPFKYYYLAGYLQAKTTNALDLDGVAIRVEADGFVQAKENALRVPLVTDEQIEPARRLLKLYGQMSQRSGGAEYRERAGLSFPSSQGNTITGIDIVLKKVGDDLQKTGGAADDEKNRSHGRN